MSVYSVFETNENMCRLLAKRIQYYIKDWMGWCHMTKCSHASISVAKLVTLLINLVSFSTTQIILFFKETRDKSSVFCVFLETLAHPG